MSYPVETRRRFNVFGTSVVYRRLIDVEMTSYFYWVCRVHDSFLLAGHSWNMHVCLCAFWSISSFEYQWPLDRIHSTWAKDIYWLNPMSLLELTTIRWESFSNLLALYCIYIWKLIKTYAFACWLLVCSVSLVIIGSFFWKVSENHSANTGDWILSS